MRSVRPSLSIVLFVGSAAALACGGGNDDDGNAPPQTTDAAVVATGGVGATGGPGVVDAGGLPPNGFGAFDAGAFGGILDGLRDSGILTTNPEGGIGVNQGAVCSIAPQYCVDGSLSLPRGDGGVRAGTGGTGGTGLTGGLSGLTGGAGGLIAGLTGGGAAGGGLLAGLAGGAAAGGIDIGMICQTNPQICAMFGGGGAAGTAP
jgi:hypothetical protein